MVECEKKKHSSKKVAMRFCKAMKGHGGTVRPYRCDCCNYWHITTKNVYGNKSHVKPGGWK